MRDVALRFGNASHQSELIKLDYWLGEIKINRTAVFAFAIENRLQFSHQFEILHQRRIPLALRFITFEDGVYRRVCHAFGGADYAWANLISYDLATMVNLHDARHDQAIYLWAQAANVR